MNDLGNRDSIGCGARAAAFDFAAALGLPAGWTFASEQISAFAGECVDASVCMKESYMVLGGGFSFGIADDAPNGDYDVCITSTNRASGLVAAKLARVTLPEEGTTWYTNNRPSEFNPAPDLALAAACAALNGACAADRPDCALPRTDNCVVDQPCPSIEEDPSVSEWGLCWADEDGVGHRSRGRNIDSITQSVCVGGPPLVETETCSPTLIVPCADQTTCNAGNSEWARLRIAGSNGDETGICGRCDDNNENCPGNWQGICASGQPGDDQSVCTGFDPGPGEATAAGFWDYDGCGGYCERQPCFTSRADGSGLAVVNTTCVRKLCEGSSLCGGYMLNAAHTTLYLYGTDISEPTWPNPDNPHECWAKPSASESSCTCVGGPLIPSEGCTEHGVYLPNQWTGPPCPTASPSPTPSPTPTLTSPTPSPTPSPTARQPCVSCDLVPCGLCQDGCPPMDCTYDQPAVDRMGSTSRNGCANANAGLVPANCRAPSPTPAPVPLPCVAGLPRAFHWDVEPHSVASRWGTDRENLCREWLELIDRTRNECLSSSTTSLKLAADISMNYDLNATWKSGDCTASGCVFSGPPYASVRYPGISATPKLLAEHVIPKLDIAVVMAYRDDVVTDQDNIIYNVNGEVELAEAMDVGSQGISLTWNATHAFNSEFHARGCVPSPPPTTNHDLIMCCPCPYILLPLRRSPPSSRHPPHWCRLVCPQAVRHRRGSGLMARAAAGALPWLRFVTTVAAARCSAHGRGLAASTPGTTPLTRHAA